MSSRAGGVVYVGTTAGLFAMKTAAGEAPKFERIPGIDTGVSAVLPREGQLLAATDTGVFAVAGGRARQVLAPKDPVMNDVVLSRRDPSLVYAVGRAGVFVLQQHGDSWTKLAEFPVPGQAFHSAREDPDGRLWAATSQAMWRVDFRGPQVMSESFTDRDGAPAGWKTPRLFQGRMVFTTPSACGAGRKLIAALNRTPNSAANTLTAAATFLTSSTIPREMSGSLASTITISSAGRPVVTSHSTRRSTVPACRKSSK